MCTLRVAECLSSEFRRTITSEQFEVFHLAPGLKWLCTVAVDNHLRENALKRELEIEDTEKTRLQEEIAAVELNFEDSKRQAEEREIEIRKEFQVGRVWYVGRGYDEAPELELFEFTPDP